MGEAKPLRLFNLIVAHEPGRWGFREALRVLRGLLPGALVFDTPKHLILLRVGDPYAAVERLAANLDSGQPILRAIPLDAVAPPYVEDVARLAARLAAEKAEGGEATFAVRVEGRLWRRETGEPVSSREAVEAIAEGIDLPVDLRSPGLLVLVKVVRLSRAQRYAGIMVAPPSSIYSRDRRRGRS